MQSLLALGDHVIDNNQPIKSSCWLNPSLVAMATYILHTCPIHCRYVRRGRGQHKVKGANEFFVAPNKILVMESKEVEFLREMSSAQNSQKI